MTGRCGPWPGAQMARNLLRPVGTAAQKPGMRKQHENFGRFAIKASHSTRSRGTKTEHSWLRRGKANRFGFGTRRPVNWSRSWMVIPREFVGSRGTPAKIESRAQVWTPTYA